MWEPVLDQINKWWYCNYECFILSAPGPPPQPIPFQAVPVQRTLEWHVVPKVWLGWSGPMASVESGIHHQVVTIHKYCSLCIWFVMFQLQYISIFLISRLFYFIRSIHKQIHWKKWCKDIEKLQNIANCSIISEFNKLFFNEANSSCHFGIR